MPLCLHVPSCDVIFVHLFWVFEAFKTFSKLMLYLPWAFEAYFSEPHWGYPFIYCGWVHIFIHSYCAHMTSLFYLSTLLLLTMLYTTLHMIFHVYFLLSQVSHLLVYTCDAVNLTDDAPRDATLTAPEVCAVEFILPDDYTFASSDPVHTYSCTCALGDFLF